MSPNPGRMHILLDMREDVERPIYAVRRLDDDHWLLFAPAGPWTEPWTVRATCEAPPDVLGVSPIKHGATVLVFHHGVFHPWNAGVPWGEHRVLILLFSLFYDSR
jgi:hypothetical protein